MGAYAPENGQSLNQINFKQRFGDHCVIPVLFKDVPLGMFDEVSKVGGITFDPSNEMSSQVDEIVHLLTKKLGE
jgi:hypothetical protein